MLAAASARVVAAAVRARRAALGATGYALPALVGRRWWKTEAAARRLRDDGGDSDAAGGGRNLIDMLGRAARELYAAEEPSSLAPPAVEESYEPVPLPEAPTFEESNEPVALPEAPTFDESDEPAPLPEVPTFDESEPVPLPEAPAVEESEPVHDLELVSSRRELVFSRLRAAANRTDKRKLAMLIVAVQIAGTIFAAVRTYLTVTAATSIAEQSSAPDAVMAASAAAAVDDTPPEFAPSNETDEVLHAVVLSNQTIVRDAEDSSVARKPRFPAVALPTALVIRAVSLRAVLVALPTALVRLCLLPTALVIRAVALPTALISLFADSKVTRERGARARAVSRRAALVSLCVGLFVLKVISCPPPLACCGRVEQRTRVAAHSSDRWRCGARRRERIKMN